MMEQVPCWAVYGFQQEIKALQHEAIIDVLTLDRTLQQSEDAGLFGLNHSSRVLSETLISGMKRVLYKWASERDLHIADLEEPWTRTQTQRLKRGGSVWPRPNRTALLMPLTNVSARVDLVPRGGHKVIQFDWNPGRIVQLSDMGLRYRGYGSVRLICVTFHLTRQDDLLRASPPTDEARVSPRGTPEPEEMPEPEPVPQPVAIAPAGTKGKPWKGKGVDRTPMGNTTASPDAGPPPGHAPIIDMSAVIFAQNYQPFGPQSASPSSSPSSSLSSSARPMAGDQVLAQASQAQKSKDKLPQSRAERRRRHPGLMEPRVSPRTIRLEPMLLPRPAHWPHQM